MILRALVGKYHWEEVQDALLRMYPEEARSLEGYALVYQFLQLAKPLPTDFRIWIRPDEERAVHQKVDDICGIKKASIEDFPTFARDLYLQDPVQELEYAIEFQP